MIQYIVECIAFQLVFLIIYDFFLKKETFFQWNRVYLIGTYVLSLVLPWIKIEALKTKAPQVFQEYPEFLWNTNDAAIIVANSQQTGFNISWEYMVLFGGMLLATVFFGYKLFQLYRLRKKGEVHYFKDFTRVIIKNSTMAFSFFKSIFLGDQVLKKEHQNILEHELVHIKEKHSYDLFFFEIMRIVGWFNPLVYVYQSRISELHEFIADAKVTKTSKKEQYEFLLSQVFQTQNISFINQFFKSSLIKKRIVMLQKSKSKKIWQLKYLLLVPIVCSMLFYTSLKGQEKDEIVVEQTINDTELIAKVTANILKQVDELGTLQKVQFNQPKGTHLNVLSGEILSKEDYFESAILFRMLMEEMLVQGPKKFNAQRKNGLARMPLPSTPRYDSYVQRKKAFQVLDYNLEFSLRSGYRNESLGVRLIDSEESFSNNYYVFEVENTADLTGDEVRSFNNVLDDVIRVEDSKYEGLILKDDINRLEIFRPISLGSDFGKISPPTIIKKLDNRDQDRKQIMQVNDVQDLTLVDERMIFHQLKIITSLYENNWEFLVKDKESFIRFIPSSGGSYITGPDGESIKARQILNFKPSKEELNFANDGALSLKQQKYNELVAERNRLLRSADESNPIVVNIDEQIDALKRGLEAKKVKNRIIYQDSILVPFAVVEEVPIFPGCENAENTRECFQKMMQKHIGKNFRYPEEAQEKGIQGRVSVMFTISTDGSIQKVRMRGPDKLLEGEAARIISLLPTMTPGKQKGEVVNVPYSIPITFKLRGENSLKLRNGSMQNFNGSMQPIYIVDGVETDKGVSHINPNNIESINVLKGEAAKAVYGIRGANGAVLITLKKEGSIYKPFEKETKKSVQKGMSVSAKAEQKGSSKIISGVVADGANLPLPGVTISIENTSKGTVSDFDGNFSIVVNKGDVLLFQYIGLPALKLNVTDEKAYRIVVKD